MSVEEFLAWTETRPGRYELLDGEIFAMSPQRTLHAETKFSVQATLRASIRDAGLPCRMLPDGMTVRIDAATSYEPDALVYCGSRPPADAIEIPEPVVVVEVLSPSTKAIDTGLKLEGYFRLPSVMHYLIVDPKNERVIHHRRGADLIETRIVSGGTLRLDPPGLNLPVAALFEQP